eukprot:753438-Hanusia_phi.AAC.3
MSHFRRENETQVLPFLHSASLRPFPPSPSSSFQSSGLSPQVWSHANSKRKRNKGKERGGADRRSESRGGHLQEEEDETVMTLVQPVKHLQYISGLRGHPDQVGQSQPTD